MCLILLSFLILTNAFAKKAVKEVKTVTPVKVVKLDDEKVSKTLSEADKNLIRKKFLTAKDDKELAIKMLRLDLAPYIKTMNRDIITYNYRRVSELKFNPLNSSSDTPEALKYAKEWGDAAKKHLPEETGVVGWGLYTAQDPFASARYAREYSSVDNKFSLTSVKYPKNSKMLDLRSEGEERESEGSIPLSKETFDQIKKICSGIQNVQIIKKVYYLKKTDLVSSAACHEIYIKTLDSLGIGGIIYQWASFRPTHICDSTNANRAAFVAFNLPLVDENINFYSNVDSVNEKKAQEIQMEVDITKKNKLIGSYPLGSKTFKDYKKIATILQFRSGLTTKGLEAFSTSDPGEVLKIKKEYQEESFGCSLKYEKDDAPTYKPDQVWDVMLADGYLNLDLGKAINNALSTCIEDAQ